MSDTGSLQHPNSGQNPGREATSPQGTTTVGTGTQALGQAPHGVQAYSSEGHEFRGHHGGRDRGDRRDRRRDEGPRDGFMEKTVMVNRTSKVVKGGRTFSFSVFTVVGDRNGYVGFGFGKAKDVSEAVRKSSERARRAMVHLPIKNGTLPHEVVGKYKATTVFLKPARPGSGIIAGGAVRAIMEASGVSDVISKCVGSRSTVNILRATSDGISKILQASNVAKGRGKVLRELWG